MTEFLIVIAYLINGVIFGVITRYLSKNKGYDGGFAWGFFLGIIGLLVVGFKPALNVQGTTSSQNQPSYLDTPYNKPNNSWICSCGAHNSNTFDYCLSCRRSRHDQSQIKKIECPHCGANNKETNELCFACNKPLTEKKIDSIEQNKLPVSTENEIQTSVRFLEVLENLAKLQNQGIITKEEFEQKKADILDRI